MTDSAPIMAAAPKLRPYQIKLVELARAALKRRQASLLVLPTGGGKTIVFTFIAHSATQRGKRVLIIAHRQEILDQISLALMSWSVPHGVIRPSAQPTHDLVQLASVATLARRLGRYDLKPDLLIVDEAHHAVAGSWRKIQNHFSDAMLLGVTATPERLDGKGLGDIFKAMIIGPDTAELTREGFLVPAAVYAPAEAPDLSGIKSRAGDYAVDQLSKRMSGEILIGNAVDHYRTICHGVPAIAFCVDRAHSEAVAASFKGAGIAAAHVDGDTPTAERRRLIAALGDGGLKVLTNCGLISEGVDVPAVGAAILLRPTMSLALYLQQVGRALRPAPRKDRAVVLDHAGNVWRHGLPDAPRQWSLEGKAGRATSEADHRATIRRCEQCGALTRKKPRCDACGFVAVPPNLPKVDEGAFLHLANDPELVTQIRLMPYWRLKQFADSEERARIVAMAKGFKRGWIFYRIRELQGAA